MTEPNQSSLGPEAAARVERLRQRRAVTGGAPAPERSKRRRPATGTRIAALGLGGTTLLGLVAAMGMADDNSGAATTAPAARPQQPIEVVIHTGGGSTTAPAASTVVGASTSAAPVDEVGTAQPAPVELRAKPVVRTVELQASAPAQAAEPAARTNGSR